MRLRNFLRRLCGRNPWVPYDPPLDHPLWRKESTQRWLASDSEVMSRNDW